jgi:hypothetical protein
MERREEIKKGWEEAQKALKDCVPFRDRAKKKK